MLFYPISSVPVAALVGWMLLLTFKHIIADFVLQSSWMAIGKDQKTDLAVLRVKPTKPLKAVA